MIHLLPPELLASLDILIAERVESDSFTPVEPVPDFCNRLFRDDRFDYASPLHFDNSPFLAHFIQDAETFWADSAEGRLKSGPWIESDDHEKDYPLEASALSLGARKFLIVELLGVDFEERRNLLQSARERLILQRHLEELVKERTKELALTQEVTIESLASLAETRDPETGGHIKRTRNYVRLLAERLKDHPRFSEFLDERTRDLLYMSAPLHDIGKVGVRDVILLKPGRLTDEEFDEIRRHTTYGRDAIRSTVEKLGDNSFLRLAQEIAYTHHEKWDGSGYPQGLKGEEIPISGRLMAVADMYDALITERVYKRPFSHNKAVKIIRDGRGAHFDPDVVDAFSEVERDFKQIALKYADSEDERAALSQPDD